MQRFLDAAFELMDEKGTTDFTIQEVVGCSKQSLRAFYRFFDGKDHLLLALFEETVREAVEDIGAAVADESDPVKRLRAFVIRLHEWCEPPQTPRKRGAHNRHPTSEFSVQLALDHPERMREAMAPIGRMLVGLVDDAVAAKAIKVSDTRRAATLIQQTVMFSWFGNRLVQNAKMRVTAEQTWDFCFRGLRG